MREILGRPASVRSAAQWSNGRFMTITFDYGSYYATLDVGVDMQKRFDCHIEVGAEYKSIKVQYDTPYIRHLPTTLFSAETESEAYVESVRRPTFKDAYSFELEQFHEAITAGTPVKTDVADSVHDLELFQEIVAAFRR
jgi:predicted dehydrogenase